MNQIYSGNYQYQQPSYNYQPSSQAAQWTDHSSYYRPSDQNYNYSNQAYSCGDNTSKTTHCMGRCNPSKLYADTYSYLTENLMNPVIEEVYHDLKTISTVNTVANNSIATTMGLSQSQNQDKGQSNYGQALNRVNQVQSANPSLMSLDHRQFMNAVNTQGHAQNINAANRAGF